METSRDEHIRYLILNATADDYEDFQMVVHEVTKWASDERLEVSPQDIAQVLIKLVQDGFERALRLVGGSPHEINVTDQEVMSDPDLSFRISAKGRHLMAALAEAGY